MDFTRTTPPPGGGYFRNASSRRYAPPRFQIAGPAAIATGTCGLIATGRCPFRVVLKAPVPSVGLEAGDVGTVVHVYRDGGAYEVEFTTLEGKTAAVVTVEASQVRAVGKREITHARTLMQNESVLQANHEN